MQNNFEINYNGQPVKVDRNNNNFTVHVPDQQLHLRIQQDSDGDNHWFEADKEHGTDLSAKLGSAIDAYLADHKDII